MSLQNGPKTVNLVNAVTMLISDETSEGISGNHCISFAFPSILTCVAFVGPGFVLFMLSMLLSFVLGFVLTLVGYKEKA